MIDMGYQLTLKGNVPSKKNSKRRVQRGANVFMVPSAAHEAWHTEQMAAILPLKDRPRKIARVKSVEIHFTADSERRADLSNKAESIMDLLVDVGILTDDNWFVVPELKLVLDGVNKLAPKAVVTIHGIYGYERTT